jgi:ABC-2 type transport system ATP-binding protein
MLGSSAFPRDPRRGGARQTVITVAVETEGLTKRYGDRVAVDGLGLRLQAGVVTGFVGPNGAGKTTTIRMLLGLVRPTAGGGRVLGHSLAHPERFLARVGALVEAPPFHPGLSGRDNLRLLARVGGIDPRRVAETLDVVGLASYAGDPFRSGSLGMKKRLGVAAALLPDPLLVLLDEPANGLNPAGIWQMRALLRSLANSGTTAFVSSHLSSEIESICDQLVLIVDGRLRFQGPIGELLANRRPVLRAAPEHAQHLVSLALLAERPGYAAWVEDDEVHVQAPPGWQAELNRERNAGRHHARAPRSRPAVAGGSVLGGDGGRAGAVVIAAFAGEWIKLRRHAVLLGSPGASAAFAVPATALAFGTAERPSGAAARGDARTTAALARPDGIVAGLENAVQFLGMVAVVLGAWAIASEYGLGALRNLLVRSRGGWSCSPARRSRCSRSRRSPRWRPPASQSWRRRESASHGSVVGGRGRDWGGEHRRVDGRVRGARRRARDCHALDGDGDRARSRVRRAGRGACGRGD